MKFHWQVLIALGLGAKRNWHIFFAIIMGAILGGFLQWYLPIEPGVSIKNAHVVYQILDAIGQVFLRSIQMIVIPLVLSSLIVGIASLGDGRQLGRLGSKVLLWFIFTTVIAAITGTILAMSIKPGEQLAGEVSKFTSSHSQAIPEHIWEVNQEKHDLRQMFIEMIPDNPVKSLARGDLIPIIIFALVFGAALTFIGEANRPIVSLFEAIFAATMKIMDWVMVLAVPGIFALTAKTVAALGVDFFIQLAPYIGTILLGLLIQLFIVFPIILSRFANVKATTLYKAVIEAMMVAFGTASSNATLPVTIATCERRAGISNRIASFVLPMGATMNMDGTAIFETVAVIFMAQVFGVSINDPYSLFILIVMGSIAAIAAAGVPSSGLVTMALVLNALGTLSQEQIMIGMSMIWIVDRLLDMCRTVVNVTSDTVIASIVAASEGELDYDLLNNQEIWKDVV